MNTQKHAKVLKALSLIYAAIQIVIFLVLGGYVLFTVGAMLLASEFFAPAQLILMGLSAVVIGILALNGLFSAVLNMRMGRQLSLPMSASRGLVIFTAIANICSFLTGAVVFLPLGIGLGIYGLWFGCSQTGRRYLASKADPSFPVQPSYALA